MNKKIHTLSPQQELEYLYEIYGRDDSARLFERLISSYDVLQNRAQMLLGLIIICMTITGFSGPKIAGSCVFSRYSIALGLFLVLFSAILLVSGPLELRWGSQRRADTMQESFIELINVRNRRTRKYRLASIILLFGVTSYIISVITYLIRG